MRRTKAKVRKIINVGGSYGVTLPIEFARRLNLKFGDKVAVVSDGVILICVPPEKPKGENK